MKRLRRLIPWIMMVLFAAAITQELRKPADERTWHGRVLFIPYDFRIPTLDRFLERWWNPNDSRIFTPRAFGIGWDINLYQLSRRARDLAA